MIWTTEVFFSLLIFLPKTCTHLVAIYHAPLENIYRVLKPFVAIIIIFFNNGFNCLRSNLFLKIIHRKYMSSHFLNVG